MKSLLLALLLVSLNEAYSQTFTVKTNYKIQFFDASLIAPNSNQIDESDYRALSVSSANNPYDSTNIIRFIKTLYQRDTNNYWDYDLITGIPQSNSNEKGNPIDYNKTSELRVVQEWFYNTKENKLDVKNIAVCPALNVFDEKGNYKGMSPKYFYPLENATTTDSKSPLLSNTDVIWGMRLQVNLPLITNPYITTSNKETFQIKSLFDAELGRVLHNKIVKGEIEVYRPSTTYDVNGGIKELEGTKYTMEDIKKVLSAGADSNCYYDELNVLRCFTNANDLDAYNLSALEVYESFEFDEKNLTVKSRITKIILAYNEYSDEGIYMGNRQKFEIRFE